MLPKTGMNFRQDMAVVLMLSVAGSQYVARAGLGLSV